jgi:hypothetical protein
MDMVALHQRIVNIRIQDPIFEAMEILHDLYRVGAISFDEYGAAFTGLASKAEAATAEAPITSSVELLRAAFESGNIDACELATLLERADDHDH